MLIENPYGIAVGDSEDPELIAFPRDGIPEIIDTQSALERSAKDLSASSLPVAVDVERAQGFRYGSSPYLLQLRREDVGSFLIDTAALPHLECLQASMNSTWILHDASQDLPNLRELGLEIPALFDTQVASRLLGM
ncbi:MAG: ribonuclease D, partial [Trueperella pyogenes]|nr:ribonuclease D [Trueperella pyogenes]